MKSFRSLGGSRFDMIVPFLKYSGSPDKVLCVRLEALIVDHRSSNEGDLWVPLGTKPHNSLRFLALSFIQLLELQEATVLRLVWMFELLFLISPSDSDTSSTYFQVRNSRSGIFKLLIITRNNIWPSFVP